MMVVSRDGYTFCRTSRNNDSRAERARHASSACFDFPACQREAGEVPRCAAYSSLESQAGSGRMSSQSPEEQAVRVVAQLTNHDAPRWTKHAAYLAQRRRHIADLTKRRDKVNRVERAITVWQSHCITANGHNVGDVPILGASHGEREHLILEVEYIEPTSPSQPPRYSQRVASATDTDLQEPLAEDRSEGFV
jgi:hypothetical protein